MARGYISEVDILFPSGTSTAITENFSEVILQPGRSALSPHDSAKSGSSISPEGVFSHIQGRIEVHIFLSKNLTAAPSFR